MKGSKAKNKKAGFTKLYFNQLAKATADKVGSVYSFMAALFFILLWLFSGPFFAYSDTWQLIINTSTTIITFLIVFLIQNTQNRDTEIINLKLDELIKAHKGANNSFIDLNSLTDEELKSLEKEYKKLCDKRTGV